MPSYLVIGFFFGVAVLDFLAGKPVTPAFDLEAEAAAVFFVADAGVFFFAKPAWVGFFAAGAGRALGLAFGFDVAAFVPTAAGLRKAGEEFCELFESEPEPLDFGHERALRPPVMVSGNPRGLPAVGCLIPSALVQSLIAFP